jgi:hypothetical protein
MCKALPVAAPGHRAFAVSEVAMSDQDKRNADTPLRWLAMSIVASPPEKRGVQYLRVRSYMAASIERFGMKGQEAKARLVANMDRIRRFVREIEAVTAQEASAA